MKETVGEVTRRQQEGPLNTERRHSFQGDVTASATWCSVLSKSRSESFGLRPHRSPPGLLQEIAAVRKWAGTQHSLGLQVDGSEVEDKKCLMFKSLPLGKRAKAVKEPLWLDGVVGEWWLWFW